jgi:carbamoylphosphate synthase large subunit
VLVLENHDAHILGIVNDVVAEAESGYGANLIKMDVRTVQVDREYVDENYEKGRSWHAILSIWSLMKINAVLG